MSKNNSINLKDRDSFSHSWSFILSCVGSAVGMGNIWLFPYRVGQFGGFAFLLPYIICVLLLGLTGTIGEMSFGRYMKSGPLGAFDKALKTRNKKGGWIIGLIPVIGSLAIAIGYSVVVAWILKFTIGAIMGAFNTETFLAVEYFNEISGQFGSLGWHIIVLIATFIIMNIGISSGIEKVNLILMPAFFVIFVILAIRVYFIPGSSIGYQFLFKPDWSALLNGQTWLYALGQSFFSLSLAGSGTVVYGSYLKDDENIVKSAKIISLFDTIAATLAALVVLPSVFAFGLKPTSGPPLLFITMPEVFKMMPFGRIFAIFFFLAVLFAGITSLVNLFESSIEALEDRFNFSRTKAVVFIAIIAFSVGIMIENVNILSLWMDIVSIYIIPLGALLAAIMFFWVCGDKIVKKAINKGYNGKFTNLIVYMGKYLFCGLTIFVYIIGIILGGIG